MRDPEVANHLMQMACGPVPQAAQIGHLLPQILAEKAVCRLRLLELLHDPQCSRLDFVMTGLTALGNTHGDTEVVDVLFNEVLPRINRESWDYEAIRVALITDYASDPRVKELAKQALSGHAGWNASELYAAVARSYGDDEELRHRVLASACPLPGSLRRSIAAFLGTGSLDCVSHARKSVWDRCSINSRNIISQYHLCWAWLSGTPAGGLLWIIDIGSFRYSGQYERRWRP